MEELFMCIEFDSCCSIGNSKLFTWLKKSRSQLRPNRKLHTKTEDWILDLIGSEIEVSIEQLILNSFFKIENP